MGRGGLMTRNEIATKLGVTPKTIFEWQKQEGFPKTKISIGGLKWRWDFNLSQVRAWLRQKKKE